MKAIIASVAIAAILAPGAGQAAFDTTFLHAAETEQAGAAKQTARYAHTVKLVFTGHWGAYSGPADEVCKDTSRNGTDIYEGTLINRSMTRDLIEYEGRVTRRTAIDSCEVTDTGSGEDWCTVRIKGSAEMLMKLRTGTDEDDEAYITFTPIFPYPSAGISGTCPKPMLDAARESYPDSSGFSFPLPAGQLRPGKYKSEEEEAGGWVLEVGPGRDAGPHAPSCLDQPAGSVTLSTQSVRLAVDKTRRLNISITDRDGKPVACAVVHWSSSNDSVATVSDTGVVMAAKPGRTTITASVGGISATTTVTVIEQ